MLNLPVFALVADEHLLCFKHLDRSRFEHSASDGHQLAQVRRPNAAYARVQRVGVWVHAIRQVL
jgi:hypothetical protein